MIRNTCSVLLLTFALLFPYIAFAQSFKSKADSLILAAFPDTTGPGGVFMIAQHGRPVYQKAVGKANLELDVNLTPGFIFQLGSMTKQFTAVAILMLEQEGKLRVTDPVSRYIPDYPNGDKITLHHLLTHTSGIKDFTRMKTISSIAQKDLSPAQVVDFFKNEPVDFQPGSGITHLGMVKRLYFESNGTFTLIKQPEPKPGLSVVPSIDPEFSKEQAYSDTAYVCCNCGKVTEGEKPSQCDNCQDKEFERPVEADQSSSPSSSSSSSSS